MSQQPKATRVQGAGTIQVKTYVPKPYDEPREGPKLVRISVSETFTGDVEGEGTAEFLQLLRSDGSASFVGLERAGILQDEAPRAPAHRADDAFQANESRRTVWTKQL